MQEKKRSFVAVHFSEEVISALARLQAKLKGMTGAHSGIKWVEPKNIHLTVQFLDDVEVDLLGQLSQALSPTFRDVAPFDVSLSGVGAFPSLTRPRVVWVGIDSGVNGLKQIFERTHRITESFGFHPDSRPFEPHVTMGRVKDFKKSTDLSELFQKIGSPQVGKCQITQVHLMASELRPQGPLYTILDSFALGR